MVVLQSPPSLNFSGNLPDVIIENSLPVTVILYSGVTEVLEERYQPDANNHIQIRLKELIDSLLELKIPTFADATLHQDTAYGDFKITIDGGNDIDFRVVKGGIDAEADVALLLQTNFLTWQPQEKTVQYHDPEWLTYYPTTESVVKAKGYYPSSDETIELATLPAGELSTIRLNYGNLISLFSDQPGYVDVWAEQAGTPVTFIQRYILSVEEFQYNDVFVFENSLGGIDAIRFIGELEENQDFKFDSALFYETTKDFAVDPAPSFTKNSGTFRSVRERVWSLEFFKSLQKYYVTNGFLRQIRVIKLSLPSVAGQLSSYNFDFTWAKQSKYLNLSRTNALPSSLNIVQADSVAVLPPRLNEFPVPDQVNILIPVQTAFGNTWYKLTVSQLASLLGAEIGSAVGIETVMSLPFKIYSNSSSYNFDGTDTLLADARFVNKRDFPITTTQLGVEFRDNSIVYDSALGTVKLLNFELLPGEHISVFPGAAVATGTPAPGSYVNLTARLEVVEKMLAPFFPISGAANGGMLLWNRPANEIPPGWQEVVDWRGRLPMGWNPADPDFDTVRTKTGGEKKHTQTIAEMPEHDHDFVKVQTQGSGGTSGYVFGANQGTNTKKTEKTGGGQGFNVLNPYRIVIFIEYIG